VNTVGENIADNGGLREAFKALKKHVQIHGQLERLPWLRRFSATFKCRSIKTRIKTLIEKGNKTVL
jgi:predicted metalloendopeptidase